ncbi:MAG: FAD-dependent oxidoreductase, partial [bacterium]
GIEDLLLDAGVRLAYNARPAAVLARNGRIGGVVYGGKFGLIAIEAACVVDASLDARIARVAGCTAVEPPRGLRPTYILHLRDAVPAPASVAAEGAGQRLTRHGHLAEFVLELPHSVPGPLAGALALASAQREVLAACRGSRRNGMPLHVFRGANAFLVRAVPPPGGDEEFIATTAAEARRAPKESPGRWTMPLPHLPGLAPNETWGFADEAFDEPEVGRLTVDALPGASTAADTADVLVAGAGTSGMGAASVAAERGLRTVCLEPHADPGGARTVGGVARFWFGRWPPFARAGEADVQRAVRAEGFCVAQALLDRAERAGVVRLPGTAACGVATGAGRVRGVFAVTPDGLARFDADAVIDATGDGDLAAFAGAPYTWGSGRDELTLWHSFGSFHEGRDEASRHFHSVADVRSLWDATRAMIVGRRQPGIFGAAEYPQPYLAPRESRHLRGPAPVTYLDVLMHRRPADTVAVARSNVDIKGLASSDAALAGFVERDYLGNHDCGIPWSALLPEGLDNLCV